MKVQIINKSIIIENETSLQSDVFFDDVKQGKWNFAFDVNTTNEEIKQYALEAFAARGITVALDDITVSTESL